MGKQGGRRNYIKQQQRGMQQMMTSGRITTGSERAASQTTGDQLNKTTKAGSNIRFGSGRDINTRAGFRGILSQTIQPNDGGESPKEMNRKKTPNMAARISRYQRNRRMQRG